MLEFALDIATLVFVYTVTFLAVVYIHEVGHYVTGRLLVGIPRSEITIVMTTLPQHVALWDDDEWVGPSEERYHERYQRYDPEDAHATTYIASGSLLQTICIVAVAGALAVSGLESAAQFLVLFSLLLTASYLVYDGVFTFVTGYPAGDYSSLWAISPLVAIGTLLFVVVPHTAVYILI